MTQDKWLEIVLGLMGIGITVSISLIGLLFSWLKGRIDKNEQKISEELRELRQYVNDRLRSLGHEDREIRSMLDGFYKIIVEHMHKGKK